MIRNRLRILRAAKKLIASPDTWTTKAQARDKAGRILLATDEDAVCFCVGGAIAVAMKAKRDRYGWPHELSVETQNISRKAREIFGVPGGLELNNELGFDAVHIVLDAAIADARKAVRP